jgi:hypothetical protein
VTADDTVDGLTPVPDDTIDEATVEEILEADIDERTAGVVVDNTGWREELEDVGMVFGRRE